MSEQILLMEDAYARVGDASAVVKILSYPWIEELVEQADARYNAFAEEKSGEWSQASAILNEGWMIDAIKASDGSWFPDDVVRGDQPSRAHCCEFDPEIPGCGDSEVVRHPQERDLADKAALKIWAGAPVVDNHQMADGMVDRVHHLLDAGVVVERRDDHRFQHEAIL